MRTKLRPALTIWLGRTA